MKSKWLFLLLWMCVIVRPEAWGQEVKSANTVAEEWIQVSSSSATVLQWFEWIEKVRESYCHIIRHRWNWGMYAG